MAEITAEKAVEWLTSDKAFGQECYSRKQIAQLIEQQAAEIAKKDKSIQLAALKLAETDRCCPDCATEGACEYNSPLMRHCYENWLTWLKKRSGGAGMSCKHEFIQEEWIVEVCKKCDKLRAQTVFEDDLAAANTRIAESEAQNKRMRELLIEIKSYAETYVDLNPRMKHIIDCAKAALEGKP